MKSSKIIQSDCRCKACEVLDNKIVLAIPPGAPSL